MEKQIGREIGVENQLFSYDRRPDLPPLTLEQEKQIVLDAREGNLDGVGLLVEHYGRDVYRHVYYMIGQAQIADEIVGDVFVKTMEAIHKYEHRDVSIKHWLVKIAHNATLDHLRRKANKPHVYMNESLSHPNLTGEFEGEVIEDLDRKAEAQKATDLISTLGQDQADVIRMRFLEQMGYREVAEVLGKPSEAVRVLQHRALRKLKKGMRKPVVATGAEGAA